MIIGLPSQPAAAAGMMTLAANESAKEALPGRTLAAAKHLELLSLEPGIIWPGCRRVPRWRRHYQMVVSEPNAIALNPSNGTQVTK